MQGAARSRWGRGAGGVPGPLGGLTLISDGATAGAPAAPGLPQGRGGHGGLGRAPFGEGEGVRVGEVLLEVVEVPDGGLLLVSSFC